MTVISETAAQALYDCVAKRGKHKGQLLAKCPPSNTLAAAAWQAAMLACNPFKVSISALMFFTDEQRAVYREIEKVFDLMPRGNRVNLDRDRAALERLGVW
jgi:hypothetical protein